MATIESVKAKIQGLIDSANAVTGKLETNLSAAVNTLVAGYNDGSAIDALINGTITEVKSDVVSIGEAAFYRCNKLRTADFPKAELIGPCAFYFCTSLSNVNLPTVVTAHSFAFQCCTSLADIVLPKLSTASNNVFDGCTELASVDLPATQSILSSAFSCDYRLTALILRSETLCTLANVNAFTNCYHFYGTQNDTYNPNGLSDGYIYVPSALVDSYKEDTNWSTLATQFRALEDYTVDGTITGELDSTKI